MVREVELWPKLAPISIGVLTNANSNWQLAVEHWQLATTIKKVAIVKTNTCLAIQLTGDPANWQYSRDGNSPAYVAAHCSWCNTPRSVATKICIMSQRQRSAAYYYFCIFFTIIFFTTICLYQKKKVELYLEPFKELIFGGSIWGVLQGVASPNYVKIFVC